VPYVLAVAVLAGMTAAGHLLIRAGGMRWMLSAPADLALAFLVGAGATSLVTYWASLLMPAWALWLGLGLLAAALAWALGLGGLHAGRYLRYVGSVRRDRPPGGRLAPSDRKLARGRWWAYPLAALALADALLVLREIVRSDPGWDGLFVWGIKARYFFATGGVPQTYFSDLSRDWSHIDYPFLLPVSEALVYRAAGVADERLIMVVIAAFFISMLVLLHELVRFWRGEGMALVAILVLLTIPALWSFAGQGMADLPLAVFVLAGGGLVATWLERPGSLRQLVLGALLLAMAVWVKREGLMAWAAAGVAVGVWALMASVRARRLAWRPVAGYLAPVLVLVPWLADLALHHVVDRNYARLSLGWLVQHGHRLPVLAHALLAELTRLPNWGLAWVLVAAALVLSPPLRSSARGFLLWVVAAHLLSLPLIYTFSTWVPYTDHVASSIDRLVFQVLPLALLLLALSIPRLAGRPAAWQPAPAAEAARPGASDARVGSTATAPDNLGRSSS